MADRVCFVRHRYYGDHPRVDKQLRAMLEAGYEVDMLLMKKKGEPFVSTEANGARVYRVPAFPRKRAGKIRYILEYVSFTITCFFWLAWMQIQRRYRVISLHSLPDFLVFAGAIPKLLGAKLILDLHEPVPEQFHTKYGVAIGGTVHRLMALAEQWSIAFANKATTTTKLMRETYIERGAKADKVEVVMDAAERSDLIKGEIETLPDDGTFRILSHGMITERYGHDVMLRAMKRVIEKVPNAQLRIFGKGPFVSELEKLAQELELGEAVHFGGFVSKEELWSNLVSADCAVIALNKDIETDLVHTHKMHEYIALDIPIVLTRTRAVEAYFSDDAVYYFDTQNDEQLANALIDLHEHPEKRQAMRERAAELYESIKPAKQRAHFTEIVQNMIGRQPSSEKVVQPES